MNRLHVVVVNRYLTDAFTTTLLVDTAVEKLRKDLEGRLVEIEEFRIKWEAATVEIASLQNQLRTAEDDAKKANEACKKMQYEWQDFKTQRDLACDEKESLLTMIERRNSELTNLREEKAELAKNLEAAVIAKMTAMENIQEVESLRITLDYK